nr:uncharacterized protein LOC128700250 [Cherax quadricarinatus]
MKLSTLVIYTIKRFEHEQRRDVAERVLSEGETAAEIREIPQQWSDEMLENLLERECERSNHLSFSFITPKPQNIFTKMDFEMADPSLSKVRITVICKVVKDLPWLEFCNTLKQLLKKDRDDYLMFREHHCNNMCCFIQ